MRLYPTKIPCCWFPRHEKKNPNGFWNTVEGGGTHLTSMEFEITPQFNRQYRQRTSRESLPGEYPQPRSKGLHTQRSTYDRRLRPATLPDDQKGI